MKSSMVMRLVRRYVSLFLIGRYYIKKDIKDIVKKYDFSGSVLDYGCGNMPYKSLFTDVESYSGIDFKNFSRNKDGEQNIPDEFFDDNYTKTLRTHLSDASYDNIVSFQVAEHHPNSYKFIEELLRLTKPGGKILLTMPLIAGVHMAPYDYFRITEYGIKKIAEKYKAEILEIRKEGSIVSVVVGLMLEHISNIAHRSKKKGNKVLYRIVWLMMPFLAGVQYLALIADKIFASRYIFLNYMVILRKPVK